MHIREHCKTPTAWFRRVGAVYACSCGQLWRVDYKQAGKMWVEVHPKE